MLRINGGLFYFSYYQCPMTRKYSNYPHTSIYSFPKTLSAPDQWKSILFLNYKYPMIRKYSNHPHTFIHSLPKALRAPDQWELILFALLSMSYDS